MTYLTGLNTELIAATLNYFLPLSRWKKTMGMTDLPIFEKYDATDVRATMYALAELGLLEKHPNSERTNALYRLNKENLSLWKEMIAMIANNQNILPKIPLRDLALLYVVGKFQSENGRPPKQTELFYKDNQRRKLGLINDFLRQSDMIEEVIFEVSGPVYIDRSARLLAQYGLMIERGSRKERKRFELTEDGADLYKRLHTQGWRKWHEMLNLWE